jgi:hypothetical protein
MNPKEKPSVPDDPKSAHQRMMDEQGHEKGAPLAPHQNRPPKDQHKGGPLPSQKK